MTKQEPESILEFPCQFPIKAMGKTSSKLDILIVDIIQRHVQDIPEGALLSRPSKNGKYTSITITIEATSKQQLDAIYQELSDHPDVLMAL
jgi:putative lipoic acid-binding regulatory protein